jgi:hypothetical protein
VNPKLVYWTIALANLAVIVVWRARRARGPARRGAHAPAHDARVGALVGLFLVSYLAKVAWLGKEDRSGWTASTTRCSASTRLCIAAMLCAGGIALYRALRFQARLRPAGRFRPAATSCRAVGSTAARASGEVVGRTRVRHRDRRLGGMLLRASD